ncbi:MAG: ABC transporter ATP-binding protein [Fuerstiella sp.]|nr:ABC transporter ATP-binding protein [Fuerstiella sp.]
MIAIRDLQFSWSIGDFTMGIPSLDIAANSSVAITGPSGSGKTTLLNIISGILPVASGSVVVSDRDLAQLSTDQRRAFRLKTVGLVFQSFELIDYLNVLDNVLLPARISPTLALTTKLRNRARDLLTRIGLAHTAHRSVTRLSQGERQRVAICRALLTDPPLLLADEPTGNLDPDNTQQIVELLIRHVHDSGGTLLMVSHDHSVLSRFDRTIDFSSLCHNRPAAAGDSGAA